MKIEVLAPPSLLDRYSPTLHYSTGVVAPFHLATTAYCRVLLLLLNLHCGLHLLHTAPPAPGDYGES
jgi:hypothetical protein